MKKFCLDNAFLLLLLLVLGVLAASFHAYQTNHPVPWRVNTCSPKAPVHMLWDALPGNILTTRG